MSKPITECCQTNCDLAADYKFTWPGKEPAGTCEKHAAQLKGLANVMGFYLHMEPIGTFDLQSKEPRDA